MRKAGAFLLLLVLALWAATPALACFAPAEQHACCSEMMQNCGPTMGPDASCCQVHRSDSVNPPAQASTRERAVRVAPPIAGFEMPAMANSTARRPLAAEAPPPRSGAASSVLRI